MPARTTAASVQSILARNYDPRIGLSPFLDTATVLTDWVASQDMGSLLTSALAERVEAHLAAHFYLHADPALQSKMTGGAGGTFQGQTAMMFSGTLYGQTAMTMDVTGALARREKEVLEGSRRKASVSWLGKPPSEQINVEDRA